MVFVFGFTMIADVGFKNYDCEITDSASICQLKKVTGGYSPANYRSKW
jgi:hypothetical protein